MLLNDDTAVTKLWRGANLKYKLRPNGQREAYDWVKSWKAAHPSSGGPLVINAHRRFGKSYMSILLGLERAISAPRQRVRVIAPTKVQGLGIFSEQWSEIMRDCPSHIEHKMVGDEIRIFSGEWKNAIRDSDYSTIHLHGSEAGGGERLRGQASDMIILDEPRDMSELEYLVKNVLGWHLLKRKRPLMVIISTPPRTADHYLTAVMIPEATAKRRYFEMPISKDKDITEEEYQFVLELCGSKDSVAWQREAECQLLADPGALIIYEWQRRENAQRVSGAQHSDLIFTERKRPDWFFPRTTIDAGYGDANGILFWYFDYQDKKMVIEDEMFFRGVNSQDLKDMVLSREKSLFSSCALWRDLHRDGDISPQQQADLWDLFKFRVQKIDTYDKMAHIDGVNAAVASGQILINERCKELLYQLRNGAFVKDGSQKFVRTVKMGHCDMVSSLVAAYRSVPRLTKYDPSPLKGSWFGEEFVPEGQEEDRASDLVMVDEREYQL